MTRINLRMTGKQQSQLVVALREAGCKVGADGVVTGADGRGTGLVLETLVVSNGRRTKRECYVGIVPGEIGKSRLAAAAPALLDALTLCMFALGRGGANVLGGPNRHEWERARAAIAKAKDE